MFTFFRKFFDYNAKELGRLQKKVEEINGLEDKARRLKDADFKKETDKLKEALTQNPSSLDDHLPWAFSLVREAARRSLGQRHFDTQLMAGIALHEGKVAEQKTGEGKTLSATTALYLNALLGKGVHLVTVNDYLARRDAGWMGTLFHFLGLTTSAIISEKSFLYDAAYRTDDTPDWRLQHLREVTRKEAYEADITYGINSEFGFDYLRDNMAQGKRDLVQRNFHYAIIDEADSVLIDEARTPHIISSPFEEDVSKYYQYVKIVRQLDPKTDFVIDEKLKTANLTETGIMRIEKVLGVDNIYEKDFDTLFHIEAALKAETLFTVDKDYIVKDGEVIIVDEFTGRLLIGRRFSEGLHQAIEAKENVPIQKESKTLATVSLQNYFRMYKKLAGMTGTAATEAEELHKIYKVNTLVVPTHRQMIRADEPDMIYKTEKGKFEAVVREIAEAYRTGRPVLVGTTSIAKNEHLSKLLTASGIPHEVLNAKNHEREAHIIARAGEKGAITVATNMAGRGVDIILGGEPPTKDSQEDVSGKEYEKKVKEWQKKHDEVVTLGGLYVIGTERHESRRIDNQLRGRSGRQGDPGMSRFFVSLEDDLMRIFGGEQISRLMTFFNFPEDQPLTHPMVSKAIEQAQIKVEGFNFDIRKHLVEFDDVLNKQREIIYGMRKNIMILPETNVKEFKETVFDIFNEELANVTNAYMAIGAEQEIDTAKLVQELKLIFDFDEKKVGEYAKRGNQEELVEYLTKSLEARYATLEKQVGSDPWNGIVRAIFLSTIDKYWMDHLTAIESLREGINLRGFAQLDPLVEYKNEAFSMFEKLVSDIRFEVTRRLFKVEINVMPTIPEKGDEPRIYKSASAIDPFTGKNEQTKATAPDRKPPPSAPPGKHKKLGRNDPCWCGSGKKYKKCHYPN